MEKKKMIIFIAKDNIEVLPKNNVLKITTGDKFIGAVIEDNNYTKHNRRFNAVIVDGVKILPKETAQKQHKKQIEVMK